MKGFKEFIMRGNLVELAVAFIIALAFATVVTSVVTIIMDIIGKAGGTPDFSNYTPGGVHVGAFITAVISFLVIAAVVYFLVVLPYNTLKARLEKPAVEEAPVVEPEVALLTEIRDLLANRSPTL
jgi:large conductance mechanosensitive channel